jgi:ribonuclease-3
MNNIVQVIVNNTNVERIGRQIHIDEIVNRNPAQQGSVSGRTITDTVQAILGAVYLDSGRNIDCVRLVMVKFGLWGQESEQLALL